MKKHVKLPKGSKCRKVRETESGKEKKTQEKTQDIVGGYSAYYGSVCPLANVFHIGGQSKK